MTDEEYIDYSIMRFKEYFVTAVAPETVACIVMEPVQGEGGFIIPPKRFVQEVRDFCSEHGIVLWLMKSRLVLPGQDGYSQVNISISSRM